MKTPGWKVATVLGLLFPLAVYQVWSTAYVLEHIYVTWITSSFQTVPELESFQFISIVAFFVLCRILLMRRREQDGELKLGKAITEALIKPWLVYVVSLFLAWWWGVGG